MSPRSATPNSTSVNSPGPSSGDPSSPAPSSPAPSSPAPSSPAPGSPAGPEGVQAFHPNGKEIKGVVETLEALASVTVTGVSQEGRLSAVVTFDYTDHTDVEWDSQRPVRQNGERVFVSYRGDTCLESEVCIPPLFYVALFKKSGTTVREVWISQRGNGPKTMRTARERAEEIRANPGRWIHWIGGTKEDVEQVAGCDHIEIRDVIVPADPDAE